MVIVERHNPNQECQTITIGGKKYEMVDPKELDVHGAGGRRRKLTQGELRAGGRRRKLTQGELREKYKQALVRIGNMKHQLKITSAKYRKAKDELHDLKMFVRKFSKKYLGTVNVFDDMMKVVPMSDRGRGRKVRDGRHDGEGTPRRAGAFTRKTPEDLVSESKKTAERLTEAEVL